MRKKKRPINIVLLEYVASTENFYREQLKHIPFNQIIKESVNKKDLPILKRLVINEFPEHLDYLLKYLLLQ